MSVAMGALIASGSLVLSAVVHRMTLIQDDLLAIGMALIPGGPDADQRTGTGRL